MTFYNQIESNIRKTWFFITLFLVLIIVLGWIFSYIFDSNWILIFAVAYSVIWSFLSYWYSDKIILSLNQEKQTRFLCTRFGNVLGSRGSVIPTFLAQIKKGGPITVTHPDMERFFMSIPEAARLVVKSGCTQKGDIFVLNMGKAVKILDLAKNLIRLSGHEEEDIPITFSGVRKGEKIYEELFSNKKNIKASEFDKLMYLEKSPEIFDLKELEEIKKAFLNLCANFDKKGIYKLLEHYVPEFSPNKNK